MEFPQILVYDRQSYFFRFLKYEFSKKIKFKKVKNNENLDDVNKFRIIVFVMYSESELYDFWELYGTGIQILVCTFNKNILHKTKNIQNINLIDTSKTKIELVKELHDFFNYLTFQNTKSVIGCEGYN